MALQGWQSEGVMRIGDVVRVEVAVPDGGVVQYRSRIVWCDGGRIGVTLPTPDVVGRGLVPGVVVTVTAVGRRDRLGRRMRVVEPVWEAVPWLVLADTGLGSRSGGPRRLWQAASSGRLPFGWDTGS